MGVTLGMFGVGLLAMFMGLVLGAGSEGAIEGSNTIIVYAGIALMIVGGLGSAVISMGRRQRERVEERRERRELARR